MSLLWSVKVGLDVRSVISFSTSFILAPFSAGIVYFFLFMYAYEIGLFLWSRKDVFTSRETIFKYAFTRLSIVLASILGWVLGRLVIRENNPFQQCHDLWSWYKG